MEVNPAHKAIERLELLTPRLLTLALTSQALLFERNNDFIYSIDIATTPAILRSIALTGNLKPSPSLSRYGFDAFADVGLQYSDSFDANWYVNAFSEGYIPILEGDCATIAYSQDWDDLSFHLTDPVMNIDFRYDNSNSYLSLSYDFQQRRLDYIELLCANNNFSPREIFSSDIDYLFRFAGDITYWLGSLSSPS